ncbi:MAG: sigma-70 family RNA polymerase sigma factor [Thermoleophilia bacterium]|nr:sigma-70 family RNA polymerase sigma factor [Thermoleophilia bacterium]
MNPTSLSLLERLKCARPDATDWGRLEEIYRPLIGRWLARVPGLDPGEAADVSQDVLLVVAREIAGFDRRREGSFRAWLRQVAVNQARTHLRRARRRPLVGLDRPDADGEAFLDRLADPDDPLARDWDREHDRHVVDRLLSAVRPDFGASTWEAFRRFGIDGEPAARVAADLGLTENAVILAKSRVLKRLREEAGDLLA